MSQAAWDAWKASNPLDPTWVMNERYQYENSQAPHLHLLKAFGRLIPLRQPDEGVVICTTCWQCLTVNASGPTAGVNCRCGAPIGQGNHEVSPNAYVVWRGTGWTSTGGWCPDDIVSLFMFMQNTILDMTPPYEAGEFDYVMMQRPMVQADSYGIAITKALIVAAPMNRKLAMAQDCLELFGNAPAIWGSYWLLRRFCELGFCESSPTYREWPQDLERWFWSQNKAVSYFGVGHTFRQFPSARCPRPQAWQFVVSSFYDSRSHNQPSITKLYLCWGHDFHLPGAGICLWEALKNRPTTDRAVRGIFQPIINNATVPECYPIALTPESPDKIARWGAYATTSGITAAQARRMAVLEDRALGAWWTQRHLLNMWKSPYLSAVLYTPDHRRSTHPPPPALSSPNARKALWSGLGALWQRENGGKPRQQWVPPEYLANRLVNRFRYLELYQWVDWVRSQEVMRPPTKDEIIAIFGQTGLASSILTSAMFTDAGIIAAFDQERGRNAGNP